MSDACQPDAPTTTSPPRRRAATWKVLGIALTAVALLIGASVPASAAELMRVTFVRHGESAGNASGLIDTSTPGPVLTSKGQQQAEALVGKLGANNYDGVYASTMVRTQLTATPTSQFLHLPIQVLPGLQEIEAGVFEGTPESQAANGYARFPLAWTFQGNRDLRIPGSINGNEFDARVDAALKTVYDNGDRNAIVFSHGGAIMFWTLMNAQNLTAAQKLDLLRSHSLSNTDSVVIEGNPEDGWTVVNWNGQQLSAQPTLGSEVQLQVRTLARQLATSAKQVIDAFATLDPAKIVAAITKGLADATYSVAKFTGAVSTKVATEVATQLDKLSTPQPATPSVQNVSTVKAASANVATVSAVATPTAKVAATTVAHESNTKEVKAPTATQPDAVESPNGATDLKDGNKAVPGTSSADQGGDTGGKKSAATTEPDADTAADAGDTGAAGSRQDDAA